MITSKRGVSTVVANVLIVLLVIVGIAVIWAVVNPTLEKSATGIQAADCFDVNVEPVRCTAGTAGTLVVERKAGDQSLLHGVRLLVTTTAGVTTAQTATGAAATMGTGASAGTVLAPLPGQLESTSYTVGNIVVGSTFNVAAVLGNAAENQVCEVLTQPVDCV